MINRKNDLSIMIKEKALEIGLDIVGITSAKPFIKAYETIKNRKLNKFIDNDPELLTNPQKHMKSAKTIIALALSYARKDISSKGEQYISLYARSKDYHLIMEDKMSKLQEYIKEKEPESELIAYCDTGAILDREIAYRAGLGWIGKNNNLINPKYGSFLVLGEIITNLDLNIDKPMESKCNECSLCIDSCPAQAFIDIRHLDSEKCLSYLTQKKGYLSEKERENIANRLWGCDTCLSVCPYNQSIPLDKHKEFKSIIEADIYKILSFSKGNLPESWKESAISWRGLRILQRNTLINIANNPDSKYIPVLEEVLENPSPVLRTYAVWALSKIEEESIKLILKRHYHQENDEKVLKEIKNLFVKNTHWGDIDD